MFKLLSKESNIFSIPVYIGFLLFVVLGFNVAYFSYENTVSALITFLGVSLGYFVFNQVNLTYQTHLPLFLYTFFIIGFYPGHLDIGIAVALLTNSFLLLILTSEDDNIRKKGYLLVGSILAINYILLPTTWPMLLFVILHVVATSERIGLNIFRVVLGILLILFAYLCIMFFLGFMTFNPDYFPVPSDRLMKSYYPLYYLAPVVLLAAYAVLDHFKHYNEKSPTSRYKYTFLLTFTVAQLITIFLYMGSHYEYLLLLALPLSIILSRMLRFMPKYWMQESGLWLCTFCLIIFKIGSYIKLI